jgi:hypothetical protein
MRGALMIGIVIVLMIIGFLVIKNMGAETSGGVTESQAQKYIERAEDTADSVEERVKNINTRLQDTD